MKKTFHKNVGNISTPEAFIDQPNINVDNEVIYKHAQASNAEQNIKSFHSSVYDTAHASNLKGFCVKRLQKYQ